MLADDRILAPGITIVEEEGTLTAADLGGNSVPNESKLSFHYTAFLYANFPDFCY